MKKRKLPDLPLPPGLFWKWYGDTDNPCVAGDYPSSSGHVATYYNTRTTEVRYHNVSKIPSYKTLMRIEDENEAIAYMAQLAWMGEL